MVGPVNSGFAQDDFFSSVNVAIPETRNSGNTYSLFGWVTQKIGYGLEAPGAPFSRQDRELAKIETSLFAQFDSAVNDNLNLRISGKAYRDDIYRLSDAPQFTSDERSKFRSRFEVKDFYVERQYDNGAYLKIGNQLFAWGLAEYLRVTDLVNTEDQFTFGQQDLEDLRLQVPAALFSYGIGDWTLDSVLTYRAGRNDIAPARDEFDQFLRFRDSGYLLSREQPDRQHEIFVRASSHWSRGDLQIVAGEFNENSLSVAHLNGDADAVDQVTYGQNRMRALGVAANWVNGSWLMFGELGIHRGKAVRPTEELFFQKVNGWEERDQILSVLGVEYNGWRNKVITFEIDNTHTRDHGGVLADDKDQWSVGTRLYWTAFNERLEMIAVWNELVAADARLTRLSLNYSWSDQLHLGLLWMDYSSERDNLFYDYRNNDILQLQLQYNFQL